MSFPEKRENLFGQKKNAGGTQKVPPTPCLRSAYTSAHAAAYASHTGRPENAVSGPTGLVGQGIQNGPVFRWKPTS